MATIPVPSHSGYVRATDPTRPRSDAEVPFRDILPKPDHPRIQGIGSHDALSWCDSRRKIPEPGWLINRLERANLERPYKGFTSDGVVREGVYVYAEDEGAPTAQAVAAVEKLMKVLDEEQRKAVMCGEVTDDEFRLWSNPELYVNPGGLRMDECSTEVQDAVHDVIKASTSEKGYQNIWGCCLTNGFLGTLVGGRKVLNEHSYNFRLFGTVSTDEAKGPWGFTFFGHHLCIAVVFLGNNMVIGPTFLGAEPDQIDEGPHKGLRLFHFQEMAALRLMQSLTPEQQETATLCKEMSGTALPPDRWNPFDERHLGGARQDNRIVPFEGLPVREMTPEQQETIVKLFVAFNEYYPEKVLAHRVAEFRKYLDETYFAWIGGHEDQDPYYYRIHSPVAFMEFDFHCGSECLRSGRAGPRHVRQTFANTSARV